MDTLDNIWDEPADEVSASRSSATPQEPLFLADIDDEDAPRLAPQTMTDIDIDIDAMFAEVEEEDNPFAIKPLTSNMNTEALKRAAEARYKKAMPSLTPHPIMSSSPPRDAGDSDQTTKPPGGGKGKEGQKERRKPMRLDEGRLLGPKGFPKLIKDTKNFRMKGKGHEVTDLNRLLQVYGYWTHELYPKTTFRDTVERVEKLCHSKRMNVSLSVWRDQAHGLVNGRQPEDDIDVIDLTKNPGDDPTTKSMPSEASSPMSNGAAYASSSSRPPSRPPSSGSEMDDDDFDIDAVIRDEEERLAKEKSFSNPTTILASIENKGFSDKSRDDTAGEDDDDLAMWEALDLMEGTMPQITYPLTTPSRLDEDNAMWDELDALQSAPHPALQPPVQDDDEDMWDVVREMETDTTVPKTLPPVTAPKPQPNPIPEDDWDSVYA
ncbi:hypothetical protein H0H87_010782 [Tephrocybe sp. NHM501043]|nr:hypothetical protein H0H87_010782 [Tephrocybe sp. NHM501043]